MKQDIVQATEKGKAIMGRIATGTIHHEFFHRSMTLTEQTILHYL